MANFLVIMRKLSNAGESIKKVNLTLIKNIWLEKMNEMSKHKICEMLETVKQIKEELSELELVLMTQKKRKSKNNNVASR